MNCLTVAFTLAALGSVLAEPRISTILSSEECDVREYGAIGDGSAIDTSAVNNALSDVRCSRVVVRNGTFVVGSLHLRSNLHFSVEYDAVLMGARNDGNHYDPAEPNPWSQYQDFGHSHFHDAMMWGEGISDVVLDGGGIIDGGEHGITSGDPPPGGGDKMISLKSCQRVTVRDLTLRRTGHFALLATNVDYLHIVGVNTEPTRDGFDIVGCRHVLVESTSIAGGGDDALVLKSDYSTGQILATFNITVRQCAISTNGATALEIGSETIGDFTDILFEDISIHSAGDAGIGIATMDGSVVSHVTYRRITMDAVTSPLQFYIGARCLAPVRKIGKIHHIRVEDVTATQLYDPFKMRNWTSSVDGQNVNATANVTETHMIGPEIHFERLLFQYKGGALAEDIKLVPPHIFDHWFQLGVRPSYAFFVRNAYGVTFDSIDVRCDVPDYRPSFLISHSHNVTLSSSVRAQKAIAFDVGLRQATEVKVPAHLVVRDNV